MFNNYILSPSGQNLVSKPANKVEKAESRDGRKQPHGPAASGRGLSVRAVPRGPPLLAWGPLPLQRPWPVRAILPSLGGESPSYPRELRALPYVIVAKARGRATGQGNRQWTD